MRAEAEAETGGMLSFIFFYVHGEIDNGEVLL